MVVPIQGMDEFVFEGNKGLCFKKHMEILAWEATFSKLWTAEDSRQNSSLRIKCQVSGNLGNDRVAFRFSWRSQELYQFLWETACISSSRADKIRVLRSKIDFAESKTGSKRATESKLSICQFVQRPPSVTM